MSNNRLYLYDVGTVRKYNDDLYKLTHCYAKRQKGFELEDEIDHEKNKGINTEKLDKNIIRTKRTIFDIAACNDFEYFSTFTLNKEKYDRYNLKKYKKDLAQWIRDYNKKYNTSIKYLSIPEMHDDGAWHIHALMKGIPIEHLTEFKLTDNIPKKIKKLIKQGRKIYNWEAYEKKFGWTTNELIINKKAASGYITKYINKKTEITIKELNQHSFYCSQGLKRPEIIHEDYIYKKIDNPDFENEYCIIKTSDNTDDLLKYFN